MPQFNLWHKSLTQFPIELIFRAGKVMVSTHIGIIYASKMLQPLLIYRLVNEPAQNSMAKL